VKLRGLEPLAEPAKTDAELRRMLLGCVTQCIDDLRICIGVLRDVTVLAEPSQGTHPKPTYSPPFSKRVRATLLAVRATARVISWCGSSRSTVVIFEICLSR
jgi:hypothetical protein